MRRAVERAGSVTDGGGLAAAPRARRAVLALALAAVLGGCAARPQDIQTSSIASRKPVEQSVIDLPPGGPAILGIVERNYSNATTQEITLENRAHNSGENRMTVTLFGPVKQVTAPENRINNDPLAILNVGPELGWYLPGVRMQISNYYTQNRYGPFGYATGRTRGGDTCIYAWQKIQAPNTNGNWFSRQGTILIRLRYCAPGATETALLELMTGFNINAYFLTPRWNPYGRVPAAPEELGKFGVSVLPPSSAYLTTGSVASAPPVSARAAVVERATAPIETIMPDMPVVPPPATASVAADAASSSAVAVNGGSRAIGEPAVAVPLDGYPTVPPP